MHFQWMTWSILYTEILDALADSCLLSIWFVIPFVTNTIFTYLRFVLNIHWPDKLLLMLCFGKRTKLQRSMRGITVLLVIDLLTHWGRVTQICVTWSMLHIEIRDALADSCLLSIWFVIPFITNTIFTYLRFVLNIHWPDELLLLLCFGKRTKLQRSMRGINILLVIDLLTHWGRVTQICVFTLQLRKTDDANLRF